MFNIFSFKGIQTLIASVLTFVASSSAISTLSPTSIQDPVGQAKQDLADFSSQYQIFQDKTSALSIETQFFRQLKRGTTGDDVFRLQEALAQVEPDFASHSTGFFGVVTEKTLKKFQTDRGLKPNGVFNIETRNILAQYLASASESIFGPELPDLSPLFASKSKNTLQISSLPISSVASASSSSKCDTSPLSTDQIDLLCTDNGYVLPTPDLRIPLACTPLTTPTPTPTPTKTPTPTPTKTPTPTPTPTPTKTPTPTPTKN